MLYVSYKIRNRKVTMEFVDDKSISKASTKIYALRGLDDAYERHNLIDMIFRDQYRGYEFEVVDVREK